MFNSSSLTTLCMTCVALAASPQAAAQTTAGEHYQLEKVVALSRHGVRPQTNSDKLEQATGRKWPSMTVPDGYLTGHGYMGVAQQAAYELLDWQGRGLSLDSHQGCPTSDQVFLWADVDQRTRATGTALADGMFPGCGVAAQWSAAKQDPLFSAAKMKLSPLDTDKVKQQVLDRMGGSPEAAQQRYQPAVDALRNAVCSDTNDSCEFLDQPWGIDFKKNGKVKLTGPVSIGSSIGETIRLQYSENLPLEQVAFGHGNNAGAVRALMELHAAKYDLVSDTPEYARYGGSLLMRQMLTALGAGTAARIDKQHDPRLERPLVLLVGHDSNIAQIQTMLGFNWQLPDYPRNDIPPGGSLELQRYRDTRDDSQWVRTVFSARTLDQWRELSVLDEKHPLPSAELHGAGCKETSVGELCPLKDYIERAQRQLSNSNVAVSVFK